MHAKGTLLQELYPTTTGSRHGSDPYVLAAQNNSLSGEVVHRGDFVQVNVFHGDIRNYKKDLIKNMKKRNLL